MPDSPNPTPLSRISPFTRGGLAAAGLLGVVWVSASITWQVYFEPKQLSPTPKEPDLEEEPSRFDVDLEHEEPPAEPNQSIAESRSDQVQPQAQPPAQSRSPELASICPDGMALVEGLHCQTVVHQCSRYLSVTRDRCQEYVPKSRCIGRQTSKRFCVDVFEYPNREGDKPIVGVDYFEARDECGRQGKRLCTSSEWELACEGSGLLPYPYGYVRDSSVCNFDKPYIIPDNDAYANPKTRQAEMARLDQREPSGVRLECVSTFGVSDMTGNVDEWVENESGFGDKAPYRSGLKGGYWGPVRNRCRPMTVDHNQWHTGYQVGFRCCSNVPTFRAEALPP
jgi:formylglycine-generating enzyme